MEPFARELTDELYWSALVAYARGAGARDYAQANLWARDAWERIGVRPPSTAHVMQMIDRLHPADRGA